MYTAKNQQTVDANRPTAMEFASCSILRAQPFSTFILPANAIYTHLFASWPSSKHNLSLALPFFSTFPRNSTFPGKCQHCDRFTAFSSISGSQDQNPSQKLAVLLEVDGVLMDAYRLGNRQTFNAAFRKLGLDCASWTEPVYLDLLRKSAGDEEKMLNLYFNRTGWPSSLPTSEKASFVKKVLQNKKIAMDEFLMSESLPLRPGVEEFIDDAYNEGIPVVILTAYSKSGMKLPDDYQHALAFGDAQDPAHEGSPCLRSIAEKLGMERISKLKIVGDKEVDQSLYGQLANSNDFSSGMDEQLAKEAIKAVSAEKQRIAEEVASLLKLNVEIDTTPSESLEKVIATLRAGQKMLEYHLTARAEFPSANATMDGFGGADLTITKLRNKRRS
ncbi:Haloacid dehalogenase-like hydrolase superfamily protein [Prunus dulcis]|uniref:Haloacid dehalogenase-like hydrolase superfamily protein n=1 Tax=Prunus dulcis TaxID=3755 RepID=A0A4Y1RAR0_PRUDU|nr:Haloacid dehalogenase-like hydrolase superfamily protein [Prunus dulcis]